jgi:hypothetical protein
MRPRAQGAQPQHRATNRVRARRFERQEFHAHQARTATAFVGLHPADANPFLAAAAVEVHREQAYGADRERLA